MDNYIITISRRFASHGHEIAARMSQILGIPVYDRSAVEARVQSLQDMSDDPKPREKTPESETASPKEKTRPDSSGRSLLMGLFRRELRDEIRDEAQLEFERQSQVIRSLVQEGPCIILGRCADQIFEEYPRALHIFIYASDEKRIQNTMEMLHTGEDEARTLVHNEDRAREAYRRRFSSHPEDEVAGRHILIDSGKLGVEESAFILSEAAKHLFWNDEESADPKPERDADPEPERDADPKPEKDADPKPERDADPKPEKAADPKPERDADPKPEKAADLKPEKDA